MSWIEPWMTLSNVCLVFALTMLVACVLSLIPYAMALRDREKRFPLAVAQWALMMMAMVGGLVLKGFGL
jgi:hypothetical protein